MHHTHIKHTCPAEMHVTHTVSRLSSKSCGAVLKDTAVWHLLSLSLSPLTLACSLCLSHTFICFLVATTDASVPLPFSSPLYSFLSPSLCSSHCSRSAAERQSSFSKPWSRAPLFSQVAGSMRTRKWEKEEGREKEEEGVLGELTKLMCHSRTPAFCTQSESESYCRKKQTALQ